MAQASIKAAIASSGLKSYLVKVRLDLPRGDVNAYALFFCRQDRGCTRSAFKRAMSKKPCENCLRPADSMTIGEVADRLARGDA